MNKFAKYVPEEDKKKQREFIGVSDVMVVNVTFSLVNRTCSFDKTLAEISDHYDNGGSVQFYFSSGYVGHMTDYVSNFMLGVTFFMSTGISGENLYSAIRCVLTDDTTTLDVYSLGSKVD